MRGPEAANGTERRIALFIDFENLVTNTGISAASFDLQPAMDRLLEKGKVVFRRAYCDWSRFREAPRRLHDFGVELIDVPPSTRALNSGFASPRPDFVSIVSTPECAFAP